MEPKRVADVDNLLRLIGFGYGDLDEMRAFVSDDSISWGICKLVTGEGALRRQKTIFVHFNADGCPAVKRAQLNSLTGRVQELLRGQSLIHATVQFKEAKSLTMENMKEKCSRFFVVDHMVDINATWTVRKSYQTIEGGSLEFGESKLSAEEGAIGKGPLELGTLNSSADDVASGRCVRIPGAPETVHRFTTGRDALRAVAQPGGPWNWLLLKADPVKLPIVGGGNGSIDELSEAVSSQQGEVLWGVLRLEFGEGRLQRTKHVALQLVGTEVSAMKRGSLCAAKGSMEAKIKDFLYCITTLSIADAKDLSVEWVLDQIRPIIVEDDEVLDHDVGTKQSLYSVEASREAVEKQKRSMYSVEAHKASVERQKHHTAMKDAGQEIGPPKRKRGSIQEMHSEEIIKLVHAEDQLNWALFGPTRDLRRGTLEEKFVTDRRGDIKALYQLTGEKVGNANQADAEIGVSYQKVKSLKEKDESVLLSIVKDRVKSLPRLAELVRIMETLEHPNIVRLQEVFEDYRTLYLVIEHCSGGDLLDTIIEGGWVSEVAAAKLMKQILSAVQHMHKHDLCHRNLNPKSLVFDHKHGTTAETIENSVLKIVDLCVACSCSSDTLLRTKANSPHFRAPEVLSNHYGKPSDMWSCGVIMYSLLSGHPPFRGATDEDVFRKIRLPGGYEKISSLSSDAMPLIDELLRFDPSRRFTATQALDHVWVKSGAPNAVAGSMVFSMLLSHAKAFRSQSELHRVARQLIAESLVEADIEDLRAVFHQLDADGDGSLTQDELRQAILTKGIEVPPDFLDLVQGIDTDDSGNISITEFLAATMDQRILSQEEKCWVAFREFDQDGDGTITLTEMENVLANRHVTDAMGTHELQHLILDADKDNDGKISFEEFMAMLRAGPSEHKGG